MKTFCLLLVLAAAASGADIAQEMVAAHNAVRKEVGDPPLAWSEKLATSAQDWANHLAESGQFAHRRKDPYGENIYEIVGAAATPRQVVEAWASEKKNFDYKKNRCTAGMCGHYTQIVWRATRRVGCGEAGRGTRQVWVCEYDPPGNYVGERPY